MKNTIDLKRSRGLMMDDLCMMTDDDELTELQGKSCIRFCI